MRHTYVLTILLFAILLVSGCQSGAEPQPIGTFINQSDTTQSLEITLDPLQTPNVFIRISIETGANKYFGKSVGRYVLKTPHETRTGTFLWAKSTRDGSVGDVWFTANDGKRWTMMVRPDGSLLDPAGVLWKR